jgi:hypothetical protein
MQISKGEQETVINFEAATGRWTVYTCVPHHVQLFLENPAITTADIQVLTEHEGKPTSIRFSIGNTAINIAKIIKKQRIQGEPSEAQLQARQKFTEMARSK